MTSIRTQIEMHAPIIAILSEDGTTVSVETEDFTELCYLAGMGEEINASALLEKNGLLVDISKKIFVELIERAHDALHGGGRESYAGEVSFEQTVADVSSGYDDPRDTGVGEDEDLSNLRSAAVHYAVQVVLSQVSAAHGLDSPSSDNVIDLAEKIFNFLKG